jgi:hypothetical protein
MAASAPAQPATVEAETKDGTLTARMSSGTVALGWRESETGLMKSFVDGLVAMQEAKMEGAKGEGLFKKMTGVEKAVCSDAGRDCLIKTAAMRQWIALGIDKKEDGATYTASGAEPECDIFYAKLVPAPPGAR